MTPLHHPHVSTRHTGRSIIELMVALALGALVLVSVLYVSSSNSGGSRRIDAMGRMAESSQVALQFIANDVRMAGFGAVQTAFKPGFHFTNYSFAGVRGCNSAFTNASGGAAAGSLATLNCPGGANTDSAIAVTYEVDRYNGITLASQEAGLAVQFADCRGFGLRSDPASQLRGNVQSEDEENRWHWRVENRYSVSNGNLVCTGNGTGPAGAAFSNTVTLVQGVERMIISYGVNAGVYIDQGSADDILRVEPGVVSYLTATDIDNRWPLEVPRARWQRVSSVRICLELMGEGDTAPRAPNGQFAPYANCAGVLTPITDGRQRRAVTVTINLRNRSVSPNGTDIPGV
jgi:type II secretory pathway pseudopilin PulG